MKIQPKYSSLVILFVFLISIGLVSASSIIVNFSASADTYINILSPNTQYTPDASMTLFKDGSSSKRPIIKVDLSSLPSTATINSAYLYLYSTTSLSGTDNTHVFAIIEDWAEDVDFPSPTWNEAFAGTSWTNAGGTYNNTEMVPGGESLGITPNVWVKLDVTNAINWWKSGELPNYGLILANGSAPSIARNIRTKEYLAGQFAPYISVNYTIPFPDVTINFPTNNSFAQSFIDFSINATNSTDTAPMGSCLLTLNSGLNNLSLFNDTADTWNYTYSSMADGGYLANFYCNNTVGDINDLESVAFVLDTIFPDINITSPINDTTITDNTIDIEYIASDINLDSCWFSNDSMSENITLAGCINLTGITWIEGQHNVSIWANDIVNQENSSSITFLIDTIPPDISIIIPTNNLITTDNAQNINYTISTDTSACWYSNDTFTENISLGTTCSNITTVTWVEGTHNINVWNNDSAGNENYATITFIVDTTSPDLSVISPINASFTNDNALGINYTISDINLIGECWWSQDSGITNTSLTTSCNNITGQTWVEGMNNITIWANDSVGNGNSTDISFILDTIFPDISIFLPVNNTFVTNTQNVNYTVSDLNLGACWYSNDTFTENVSLTCGNNITDVIWVEGTHNVNVYANDTAGNINSSDVSFKIDTTPPDLSILFPSNNTFTSDTIIRLNYTVSEVNLIDSCWFSNDSMSENTTLTDCGTNITGITWTEGVHNVSVWANDSVNNLNQSDVVFTIDTINPDVNLTNPENTSYILVQNYLNYTVSDINMNTCEYSTDGGTINNSITCGNNVSGLTSEEGGNNWMIKTTDLAGNTNVSYVAFTVDSIPPNVLLSSPANDTNITTHWQNLTANLSDATSGIKNATLYIENDVGAIINVTSFTISGSPSFYEIGTEYTFLDGTWYWYYESYDQFENKNTSEKFKFSAYTAYPITSPATATSPPGGPSYIEGNWANDAVRVHLQCLSDCTNIYYCTSSTSCNPLLGTLGGSSIDVDITPFQGTKYLYYAGTSTTSSLNETAKSFTIRMDTVEPSYSNNLTFPDSGADYSASQNYQFNITWTDATSSISNAIFSLGGTNYTMNNLGNEYYYGLTGLSAGTYSYYFWANDSANNQNITETQTFIVRSITSTTLGFLPASPIIYGTQSNFSCWTDSGATPVLTINGADKSSEDSLLVLRGAGTYTVNCSVAESGTYTGSSSQNTYIISAKDSYPGMSITGTTPITYGTTSDFAEAETNTADGGCSYSLDLSNDVYGAGTWTFNYSTAGCTNYTSGSVTKDLIVNKNSSLMYLYLNNSESDFEITQGEYVLINATTSSGEGVIGIFVNNTQINNGTSPIFNESYFYLIGDYNITAIHPDTQNYTNSFVTFLVNAIAETTAPSANLTIPENNTINSTSADQNFTGNFTDNLGVKNATLYIYTQGGDLYNQTSSENFDQGVTATIWGVVVTVVNGIYDWFYELWDWGGNSFISENSTFTYDTNSPVISLDSPLEQTYNYLNISLNYTISDVVSGVSSCWYKIENTSTIIANNRTIDNCENSSIILVDEGVYTLNFYSNDSANNINTFTRDFEIRTTAPTVILESPLQEIINYKTNIYFNYTPSSSVGLDTCELWGNWTGVWALNQSRLSPTTAVSTNFSTLDISDGRYLWNVNCNDTNGLSSFALANWTFEVDTISPVIAIDSPLDSTEYSSRNISLEVSSIDANPSESWWYDLNGVNFTFSPNSTILADAGVNNLIVYNNDSANNLGSSSITFNVSSENLLEISIPPFDYFFGTNLSIKADVVPHNLNISYCNFNLINPDGLIVIYDVPGTMEDTEGKLWGSEAYVLNQSGTWWYNVTCENINGLSAGEQSSFDVESYALTYTPETYMFAARSNRNETNSFTIYMYDNSNASITYALTSVITNSSNFTLSHDSNLTLDDNDTEENPYSFTFSINASEDVADGLYEGNILLTNPISSEVSYVYFVYGIKPPSGLPRMRFGSALCTSADTTICNNYNISLVQNTVFSITYNISDDGEYDLTDCNISLTGSLASSWVTESIGWFNLSINKSVEFTLYFTPTTSVSPSVYSGYAYVHCKIGDALNSEVQNPSSNWIFNKVIITSAIAGEPPAGGGAPPLALNKTEILAGLCGNNICEPAYNETSLTCPADCTGDLTPISSCFSSDQSVREENCLFYKATGLVYIFVFIVLIVLFTLFFEFKKKKGTTQLTFIPLATKKRRKR